MSKQSRRFEKYLIGKKFKVTLDYMHVNVDWDGSALADATKKEITLFNFGLNEKGGLVKIY